MRIRPSVVILALTCLMACAGQTDKSVREENRQETPRPIVDQQTRIAPGKCRIVGTLVSIDTTMEESGPCSKAPCRGIVRIDSVLGYGSAFGNPIGIRGEIAVRFAFTLGPTTKDLFPNMTERLPGLNVGSRFQTDLESHNDIKASGSRSWYLVYDYRKSD